MPTIYNGGQSPLEARAIEARGNLIPLNFFNNADNSNNYGATHTRALSDSTTPFRGKGSGGYLDIENYETVGDSYDINGNSTYWVNSGRNSLLTNNSSTWGYGPVGLNMQNYVQPNMSLNVGQVIIQ